MNLTSKTTLNPPLSPLFGNSKSFLCGSIICIPILIIQIVFIYYSSLHFNDNHLINCNKHKPLTIIKEITKDCLPKNSNNNKNNNKINNNININNNNNAMNKFSSAINVRPIKSFSEAYPDPKLFHPYPNLPAPKEEINWLQWLYNDASCKYKSRVFNLGMFKTGTTSVTFALEKLGYKCGGPWMNTCKFHKMHAHFPTPGIHETMFLTGDITELYKIDYLWDYFRIMTSFGSQFADGPWMYLYPYFDIWYPNSKYILTQRDSWDLVNSDLKMYCRTLKLYDDRLRHHIACNETSNYNTTQVNTLFDHWHTRYETTFKDYLMLIARRYELHNENVIKYFKSRNKSSDLLILNLFKEDNTIIYKKIMKHLGCNGKPPDNGQFPKVNVAHKKSGQFIPKNYNLNWRGYKYKTFKYKLSDNHFQIIEKIRN